tara:strand:+ start:191 stop:436 length:246 start_codon:yes stop_codon:yes gene_type:complete
MRFGDNWQYETGSTLLPNRRIKGTAKLLKTTRNQTQKWEIKVTDTETNEILEEAIIMAKEGDTAIARAHELAKAWREKYES